MAADAGIGAAAFRHPGRGVVRAARTEIGNALGDIGRFGQRALSRFKPRDVRGQFTAGAKAQQPLANGDRDVVGIERALDREQPVALLVLLADADRLIGGAVQFLARLHFDQRTLLLDHNDEIEALRKVQKLLAVDRPDATDLEQAQADIIAFHFVDAEFIERLADVEIGLAGGDDADLRIAPAGRDDLVELVGAHEGQHGVALEIVQAGFLTEDGILQADVETAFGHVEIGWGNEVDAVETGIDDAGRLDRLVHAFERGPGAGVARHRPAIERVVDDLLHAARLKDRHHHVDEMEFRLMRGGGGFGGVVVAHQRQHAAVLGSAGEIGVAEYVARTIDARTFAVPKPEHAIEFALAAQLGLLRAPERGGGEFLVEAGLELDVGGAERARGADELLVETAERRAAITGEIAGGVDTGGAVARLLHQAGAD